MPYFDARGHIINIPLRVGMFLRHPRPGFYSIETVFETVSAALPKEIASVCVVSPQPSRGLVNRFISAFAAIRAVRLNALQIAHVLGDEHFLVLALPWQRTVLTIHDCDALLVARGLRGLVLRLLWLHIPVRISAAVTTVSERSKAQIIELTGCATAKVRVIENPLPAQFYTWLPPLNRKPRVLHIGTKPNKNLPRLIDAMVGLNVDLTVIGRLTDVHIERLRASGLSWENLVDISEEGLLQAYHDCTLLSFVSVTEGFGMPIIEAQALGRPVLTSDISPMREVAGDAALLVDPNSITAIRVGLQRLVADAELRATLVEAGLRNVRRFSANAIARRYAELYMEVARGSACGARNPEDVQA